MKRICLGILIAAGALLSGCRGNLATFQPARTMPAKGFAVGIEGSGIGSVSDAGDKQDGTFAIAGRYAVNQRVEIGARVGTTRPEIMAKIRLDAGKPEGTAISFAPSVGAFAATATGILALTSYGQLPILVGIPVGRHEIVLSGALHFGHAVNLERDGWGLALGPGASVGFVAQPLPWLSILPSLAMAMPFFHAGPIGVSTGDTVAYQLGIAAFAGKLH